MKKLPMIYNRTCLAVFGLWMTMLPSRAHAFTLPSDGDVAYEMYEFFHDVVLTGAVGVVIILSIVCYAVYWILKSNIFGAVGCFVAAILFYAAEDIATAMGCMF